MRFHKVWTCLFTLSLLTGLSASAQDVDPATLYELSTQGTSPKVKKGDKGTFVLSITAKNGAHVSNEAPLKLELSGQKLTPQKTRLTLADSVAKKAEGEKYANPRFEVPVTADASGQGTVDGKLTFFICTDTICARQQKTVSVPVEVQ